MPVQIGDSFTDIDAGFFSIEAASISAGGAAFWASLRAFF
jgi:hypothetical protein